VAASVTRYVIGATPVAEGPAFMVNAFITWFVPAAVLVTATSSICTPAPVREQVNAAELQRAALESSSSRRSCASCRRRSNRISCSNTLSNVRRLCQSDAGAGRAMLAHLARYLRAALPRMRDHDVSLADEIELVRLSWAYRRSAWRSARELDRRAGAAARGSRSLDDARDARRERDQHGIGPLAKAARSGLRRPAKAKRWCSRSRYRARIRGGFRLGRGTRQHTGAARRTIRERATLKLEANSPRGVIATIRLRGRGEERP